MQTANELLGGILQVVGKIEQNQQQDKKNQKSSGGSGVKDIVNISSALSSFSRIKPVTTKRFIDFSREVLKVVKESNKGKDFKVFNEAMIGLSQALPVLADGLSSLGRIRARRVDRALNSLQKLYDLMYALGGPVGARRVERAIKLFNRLGRALRRITRPLEVMGKFLGMLGISFVLFAGGIFLASKILKTGSPMGILGALVMTIGVLALVVGGLVLLGPLLKRGIRVVKRIGKAFMYISAGLLGFALSLLLLASYLKTGNGFKGIGKAMLVLTGVILVMVGMFMLLGVAGRFAKRGIRTARRMGFGLFVLVAGIFLFALGLVGVAAILGKSKDSNGIVGALGMMALVIIAMVGFFWVLGRAAKKVVLGTLTAFLIAAGIMAIGYSVKYLANIAKELGDMGKGGEALNKKGEKRGRFGQMMAQIGPGLGMVGIIFLSATLLFAALGIPQITSLVMLGAVTAAAIAGSLILIAIAVKKLSEVSATLPTDFKEKLSYMIKSLLTGLLDGVSVLTTGGTTKERIKSFLKNSVKIFAITGVLISASIALSQFAKAMTAFATLHEMRPIIGTKPNGDPIFGEKINIVKVSENISFSIGSFLSALIESTEGLTKSKAGAIRKLARALTGKRGILTAVIQFTDVLKAYAEFGAEGEIGYAITDPDTGEIVEKKSIPITSVVQNIIDSFGAFVNHLTSHSDEFSLTGKQGRKMKKLAEVLLGKKGRKGKEQYGLLQPIEQFAETLAIYGRFGSGNMIPIIDPETNEIIDRVNVEKIASNLVSTLSKFVSAIGDSKMTGKTKSAEKNMEQYAKVIELVHKTSTGLDSLSKMTDATTKLAESIKMLSTNLAELDTSKFEAIAAASGAFVAKTEGYDTPVQNLSRGSQPRRESRQERREEKRYESVPATTTAATPKPQEIDWDKVSNQIGETVSTQMIAAMKSGQVKFVFSGGPEGIMEWGE